MEEPSLSPAGERFEETISCPICKDLFVVPTATNCGHIFCSICISRHLASQNNCPSCGQSIISAGLRPIKSIENAIAAWKLLRPELLSNLATAASHTLNSDSSLAEPLSPSKSAPEIAQPAKGTAPCPICGEVLPVAEIESTHIIKCLSQPSKPRSSRFQRERAKPTKIPLVNYMTLNDKALRKQLQEAGLPSSGQRARLIARHREWQLQWNANAESQTPEPASAILQRVKQWEKAIEAAGKQADEKMPNAHEWNERHRTEFEELEEHALAQLGKRKRPGSGPEIIAKNNESRNNGPQNSEPLVLDLTSEPPSNKKVALADNQA